MLALGAVLVATVFVVRAPGNAGAADRRTAVMPIPARSEAEPSAQNLAHSVAVREQTLKNRLEENPQDEIARIELARFYHDSHRPSEAIEHYEAFLRISPDNRQVWLDFAECLSEEGEWDRARSATEALLERWPGDPAGMYNLGAILANAGDREGARTWWGRVRDEAGDPELAAKAAASLLRL